MIRTNSPLDQHERDEAEHALGGEPPREAARSAAAGGRSGAAMSDAGAVWPSLTVDRG